MAKRAGAVARNGTKLLGVGFFASLFGVTVTNVLVKVPASCTCRIEAWLATLHIADRCAPHVMSRVQVHVLTHTSGDARSAP